MKKILMSLSAILAAPIVLSATTAFAATGSGPGTTGAGNNLSTGITSGAGFLSTNTTPASAKSTAEFDVTAGDLTLDNVPDFMFEGAKVGDLANGDFETNGLKYHGDTVGSGSSKNVDAFDGNGNGDLQVTDYRGTLAGWQLTATISDFKQGDSTIPGPTLKFVRGSDSTGVFNANATIGSSPSVIANAPKNTSNGSFITSTDDSTTLTVPAFKNILSGTYQGTITWALQSTPTPSAPTTTTPATSAQTTPAG